METQDVDAQTAIRNAFHGMGRRDQRGQSRDARDPADEEAGGRTMGPKLKELLQMQEANGRRELYTAQQLACLRAYEAGGRVRCDTRKEMCSQAHGPGCLACTTCHFCRQKTIDAKTTCSRCGSESGIWCGPCLAKRMGQDIVQVRARRDWVCPRCLSICNCSGTHCVRLMAGLEPTGQLFSEAKNAGFPSVAHYLIETLQTDGIAEVWAGAHELRARASRDKAAARPGSGAAGSADRLGAAAGSRRVRARESRVSRWAQQRQLLLHQAVLDASWAPPGDTAAAAATLRPLPGSKAGCAAAPANLQGPVSATLLQGAAAQVLDPLVGRFATSFAALDAGSASFGSAASSMRPHSSRSHHLQPALTPAHLASNAQHPPRGDSNPSSRPLASPLAAGAPAGHDGPGGSYARLLAPRPGSAPCPGAAEQVWHPPPPAGEPDGAQSGCDEPEAAPRPPPPESGSPARGLPARLHPDYGDGDDGWRIPEAADSPSRAPHLAAVAAPQAAGLKRWRGGQSRVPNSRSAAAAAHHAGSRTKRPRLTDGAAQANRQLPGGAGLGQGRPSSAAAQHHLAVGASAAEAGPDAAAGAGDSPGHDRHGGKEAVSHPGAAPEPPLGSWSSEPFQLLLDRLLVLRHWMATPRQLHPQAWQPPPAAQLLRHPRQLLDDTLPLLAEAEPQRPSAHHPGGSPEQQAAGAISPQPEGQENRDPAGVRSKAAQEAGAAAGGDAPAVTQLLSLARAALCRANGAEAAPSPPPPSAALLSAEEARSEYQRQLELLYRDAMLAIQRLVPDAPGWRCFDQDPLELLEFGAVGPAVPLRFCTRLARAQTRGAVDDSSSDDEDGAEQSCQAAALAGLHHGHLRQAIELMYALSEAMPDKARVEVVIHRLIGREPWLDLRRCDLQAHFLHSSGLASVLALLLRRQLPELAQMVLSSQLSLLQLLVSEIVAVRAAMQKGEHLAGGVMLGPLTFRQPVFSTGARPSSLQARGSFDSQLEREELLHERVLKDLAAAATVVLHHLSGHMALVQQRTADQAAPPLGGSRSSSSSSPGGAAELQAWRSWRQLCLAEICRALLEPMAAVQELRLVDLLDPDQTLLRASDSDSSLLEAALCFCCTLLAAMQQGEEAVGSLELAQACRPMLVRVLATRYPRLAAGAGQAGGGAAAPQLQLTDYNLPLLFLAKCCGELSRQGCLAEPGGGAWQHTVAWVSMSYGPLSSFLAKSSGTLQYRKLAHVFVEMALLSAPARCLSRADAQELLTCWLLQVLESHGWPLALIQNQLRAMLACPVITRQFLVADAEQLRLLAELSDADVSHPQLMLMVSIAASGLTPEQGALMLQRAEDALQNRLREMDASGALGGSRLALLSWQRDRCQPLLLLLERLAARGSPAQPRSSAASAALQRIPGSAAALRQLLQCSEWAAEAMGTMLLLSSLQQAGSGSTSSCIAAGDDLHRQDLPLTNELPPVGGTAAARQLLQQHTMLCNSREGHQLLPVLLQHCAAAAACHSSSSAAAGPDLPLDKPRSKAEITRTVDCWAPLLTLLFAFLEVAPSASPMMRAGYQLLADALAPLQQLPASLHASLLGLDLRPQPRPAAHRTLAPAAAAQLVAPGPSEQRLDVLVAVLSSVMRWLIEQCSRGPDGIASGTLDGGSRGARGLDTILDNAFALLDTVMEQPWVKGRAAAVLAIARPLLTPLLQLLAPARTQRGAGGGAAIRGPSSNAVVRAIAFLHSSLLPCLDEALQGEADSPASMVGTTGSLRGLLGAAEAPRVERGCSQEQQTNADSSGCAAQAGSWMDVLVRALLAHISSPHLLPGKQQAAVARLQRQQAATAEGAGGFVLQHALLPSTSADWERWSWRRVGLLGSKGSWDVSAIGLWWQERAARHGHAPAPAAPPQSALTLAQRAMQLLLRVSSLKSLRGPSWVLRSLPFLRVLTQPTGCPPELKAMYDRLLGQLDAIHQEQQQGTEPAPLYWQDLALPSLQFARASPGLDTAGAPQASGPLQMRRTSSDGSDCPQQSCRMLALSQCQMETGEASFAVAAAAPAAGGRLIRLPRDRAGAERSVQCSVATELIPTQPVPAGRTAASLPESRDNGRRPDGAEATCRPRAAAGSGGSAGRASSGSVCGSGAAGTQEVCSRGGLPPASGLERAACQEAHGPARPGMDGAAAWAAEPGLRGAASAAAAAPRSQSGGDGLCCVSGSLLDYRFSACTRSGQQVWKLTLQPRCGTARRQQSAGSSATSGLQAQPGRTIVMVKPSTSAALHGQLAELRQRSPEATQLPLRCEGLRPLHAADRKFTGTPCSRLVPEP